MTKQNKLKDPLAKDYISNRMELIINEFVLQGESQETVKEIIKDLKEKYDLSPATIRKVARAKANDKLNELLQVNSEAVELMAVLN
jgi:phosphatidate phosphatase PAH1